MMIMMIHLYVSVASDGFSSLVYLAFVCESLVLFLSVDGVLESQHLVRSIWICISLHVLVVFQIRPEAIQKLFSMGSLQRL